MKWEKLTPEYGDIVRVAIGMIYHYGIYISDSEIIQFGQPPTSLIRRDSEIVVCSTDISSFLCGGEAEIGVSEPTDGEMRNRGEIADLAKSRLGSGGYDIIHNNCEHFVYECAFGRHYSFQEAEARIFWRNMPLVEVYCAEIPFETDENIFPELRLNEISAVRNEKLKSQKFYAWKLLEFALKKAMNLELGKLNIKKTADGKWVCGECFFSISHTDGVVAAAVSRAPCGVDIEKYSDDRFGEKFSERILCKEELDEYALLPPEERKKYTLRKWTEKESLFKKIGEGVFVPESISPCSDGVISRSVTFGEDIYYLTLATDTPKYAKFRSLSGKLCFEKI